MADRSAQGTAVSGNLGKGSRCLTVEPEDAARQILGKHSLRCCQQSLAALAFGEVLVSRLANRGYQMTEAIGPEDHYGPAY